jgi:FkbM family methyltransferase
MTHIKSLLRKIVQLLNGVLLSSFNAKIVRAYPNTFSYRKSQAVGELEVLVLKNNINEITSNVHLRKATSDWFTFDQIFIHEDYNLKFLKRYAEIQQLYTEIAKDGVPLILDLGANIGLSSLYFHHVWNKSQIVAIEPSSQNYEILTRNFDDNSKLKSIMAGISSKITYLKLVDASAEKNAFTTCVVDNAEGGGVNGITVPAILLEFPEDKGYVPFIVKIDIEGFESDLFSENTEWIQEFPVLIIEMHDWLFPGQGTSSNFLKVISKLDRDFVYFGENVFSIRNNH